MSSSVAERGSGEFSYHSLSGRGRDERVVTRLLAGLGGRGGPSGAGCLAGLGGRGGPSGAGCLAGLGGRGGPSGAGCLAGSDGPPDEGDEEDEAALEAPDDTNKIFPGFLGAAAFFREGVLLSFFCLPFSVGLAFLVGGASLSLSSASLPPFLFLLGSSFSFPSL